MQVEVVLLHISEDTADHILEKHGLEASEVRLAVEGVGGLPARLQSDPDRGSRALVVTAVRDQAVLAVLYPSRNGDPREWHLGTAYPIYPI